VLEFRILGPVEVVRDDRALPLGGAKQRALVADLALHANEVLSADRIIDDLWGEEPPETASHMLHVYVSRLRKTLGDHGGDVLVTRPPGYMLRLEPPDELDATRFEARVRAAAEIIGSRPADALEALNEALGRWRGHALEEFSDEPFAQPSAARLEELRRSAEESRVEALLALGRHDEAIVELEGLITRFPLRERLRELQMLALYRAGRQADALQAFQVARRTLADELGVDPGQGLASLEQAILRHDAALDPPPRRPAQDGAPGATRPAPRRVLAVGLAALVVGVAALLLLVLRPASEGVPTASPSPTAGIAIDRDAQLQIRWTEVPDPGGGTLGGPGDQAIQGGVEAPDALLAVGYSATRPSETLPPDYDAAVWIATGAKGWRRIDDAAFAAAGNQEATDAIALDERLVVIGADSSTGDHDAAVWTLETNARSWERVAPDAPGMRKPGEQWMRALTWTGSLLVVVGANRRPGADDDVAVWTSADGRAWNVLVSTNLQAPGDQQMTGVTTFGDLVVAGGFSDDGADRDAAIWVSRDASAWEPLVDDALGGAGDQQIASIAPAGPGLVAVGWEVLDGDQDAAVWISVDGRAWERVADPSDVFGGPEAQQMASVVAADGVIVAAGADGVGSGADGAVWTSVDGSAWRRQSPTSTDMSTFTDFGRQRIQELLVEGDHLAALGREGRGPDDDADVWIGRLRT